MASASPAGEDRQRIEILGVPLDAIEIEAAREAARAALADEDVPRCLHIATLNPEYVMAARKDAAFAAAIERADLITADGAGVSVAARLLSDAPATRTRRITGVDLVDWLAEESGRSRSPVFLLGARPGVAAAAAARLKARFPAARIAGWWSGGSAAARDDEETIMRIGRTNARAVAVAYGAPGQVIWIDRNRDALAAAGVRVAVGIGGAFDVLAGRTSRAPGFVRTIGMEWLYRLLREPWRWRRQRVLPVFAVRVALAWLWRRGNRAGKIAKPK